MKTILIDAGRMNNKDFHNYFRKKLDIKGYYGNNLDAMYDVLSTYRDELRIYVYNLDERDLGEYGTSVLSVLRELDFARDNIILKTVKISAKY